MHWSKSLAAGCFAAALVAVTAAEPALAQGNYSSAVAAGPNEVFVGEPLNNYAPGAVYVYSRGNNGKWSRAAVLNSSKPENLDRFGRALALDGTTLLVGATSTNDQKGGAFVFTRDRSGAWREAAALAAPDGVEGDAFGRVVALEGDVALITAAGRDSARGAVYVYRRSGTTWRPDGVLRGDDAQPNDGFGQALAIVGERVIVGAPQKDSAQGAAYVFRRDASGSWTQEGKLPARGLDKRFMFGSAAAAHGGELYVSAPRANNFTGTVFVFRYDTAGSRWAQVGQLQPFETGFAMFGSSIEFDGNTAFIGAPAAGRFEGRIYRLERDSAGNWGSATVIAPKTPARQSGYGAALALAGRHGVIGMPGADFGAGEAVLVSLAANGSVSPDTVVRGETKGLTAITGAKVDCASGKANLFGCNEVDMLSFLPVKDIGGARGVRLNDIWGWTDPETNREYAIVGRVDGTSFVDVTDPLNPRYLGDLPKTEKANAATWRDMKVYKNHVYIVADGSGEHGMQVFDLTKLRGLNGGNAATFAPDFTYTNINSAHNIVIDTASGYAFAVGSSQGGETCGGGLHMIDIREPKNPKFAGCFADPNTGRAGTGYIHDAQCVVYNGPAERFRGRQLCFNAAETALSIADVTDKANPVALSHAPYPNVGYSHQGWLDEEHRYFYMDDELDELNGQVQGTRTLIWDVSDPTDPVLAGEYVSENRASDHNLYIRGNLMYQSNYQSGLRIVDITNRTAPVAVGHFDTVPVGEDEPGFGGSWSNYPYFASGTIVVTSGDEGLFVLKKQREQLTP
ncbi:MAG: choice-of-anchor B family protein [Gemmatimonadota bacterium]|nr:choice-of-anchor B family protein [Gemmatimonadota bacterium]